MMVDEARYTEETGQSVAVGPQLVMVIMRVDMMVEVDIAD